MLIDKTTLAQFLIEERRNHPEAIGELNSLVLDVAVAIKAISGRVSQSPFGAGPGTDDADGNRVQQLRKASDTLMLRATQWGGEVVGLVSENSAEPYPIPNESTQGKYLLCFDALDGCANIDINMTVGTVFSILRSPRPGEPASVEDFLQPGTAQVCAGYALYGPATMLVLTVGRGVHGFTLDRTLGEFILTHPDIKIPEFPGEFAINPSNSRFWEPAVRRYVDECLEGSSGPRERDFTMRWIATCIGDMHGILVRGGVYLSPQDESSTTQGGLLGLLYGANPIAFLIEQAGGRASDGAKRIMEIEPAEIHQRVGLIFGDADEVTRIERYHRETDPNDPEYAEADRDIPLYGTRGLFRTTS